MKRLNRKSIERACAQDDFHFVSSRDKKRLRKQKGHAVEKELDAPARPPVSLFKVGKEEVLPQILPSNDAPIKLWSRALDANAWKQVQDLAKLPFIHPNGIALMPDVHVGNGACVGSVLPFRQALVPSSIGVDSGCGMQAVQLSLKAEDLPDDLRFIRQKMEEFSVQDEHEELVDSDIWSPLHERYKLILQKHPRVFKRNAGLQLGTLGGGNHFNEICLDENRNVWVMLHSGSRGAGNNLGKYFIEKALRRSEAEGFILPNRALGYLPEGCPEFDDYLESMLWAQDYAKENRNLLMQGTLKALQKTIGKKFSIIGHAVSCHHNYVAKEIHFGEELWITRKGAVRAGLGELALIPGSMGHESFVVRGKGNLESYCSCAHGAGRLMSRGEAKQNFTTADLRRQTEGVECRKDKGIIDEIPSAYKPIREVMNNQLDLVDIVHRLKQIVCVKAG